MLDIKTYNMGSRFFIPLKLQLWATIIPLKQLGDN